MQKRVNLVDLVKSVPYPFFSISFSKQNLTDSYSNEYLLAKIGVGTAENESLKLHLIFNLLDFIFTDPPCPRRLPLATARS